MSYKYEECFDFFKDNPSINELWKNPKGEFFSSKNRALNSVKKASELECILREIKSKKPISKLNKPLESIASLELKVLEEKNGKNRKTVINAIKKRIEKLKNSQDGKS